MGMFIAKCEHIWLVARRIVRIFGNGKTPLKDEIDPIDPYIFRGVIPWRDNGRYY